MGLAQVLAAAILGAIYTFAGYRWIRFTTRLASAALFGLIAGLLVQDRVIPLLQLGVMLAAGVLGYLLGNALYYLLVLLYGAAAGALLAGGATQTEAWILLAAAVVGGLLALLFERPIVIVASSVLGGFLLASVIQGVTPDSPASLHPASLAMWGVLVLLGVIVQARTLPDRRPPPA